MDFDSLGLLVRTLKYLKPRQVWYRLFYFIRNRLLPKKNYSSTIKKNFNLNWKKKDILFQNSFYKPNEFEFLNLKHKFPNKINWDFNQYGKLWTYNLNYFDFLNQEKIGKEKALELVWDYISDQKELKVGLEPYPISLRGINWIKFLSRNSINEPKIDETLFGHYQILFNNLEYHLLGNHLLENGFSLLFGAYYFRNEKFYEKSSEILTAELSEQVLNDGGHFELSPMYHQIMLHRVLDCVNLIANNPWKQDELQPLLIGKAQKMLGWLGIVTFENGNIPMVNDSAFGIAPTSEQLFGYAEMLGIRAESNGLKESGYRKFRKLNYELFLDVGEIGPSYQPGHAHSDTFNFELYINNRPVIVDTGTSTYEKNNNRLVERQTAAHNTVKVEGREQTEVWGGFRVAKRARITELKDGKGMVTASHNGYLKSLGVVHQRSFEVGNKILIQDKLLSKRKKTIGAKAFLHFHPDLKNVQIIDDTIQYDGPSSKIHFHGDQLAIRLTEYQYAAGFNNTLSATKAIISFSNELTTTIHP